MSGVLPRLEGGRAGPLRRKAPGGQMVRGEPASFAQIVRNLDVPLQGGRGRVKVLDEAGTWHRERHYAEIERSISIGVYLAGDGRGSICEDPAQYAVGPPGGP